MTFVSDPHRRRWDWSSEGQRRASLEASYRAGCGKDGRSALLRAACLLDLSKKTLWSSLCELPRSGSPGLSVRFLKLWNHTPTTRPSSLNSSSSKTLEKHNASLHSVQFQHNWWEQKYLNRKQKPHNNAKTSFSSEEERWKLNPSVPRALKEATKRRRKE